jgi:hypothetical protein
MPDSHTQEIVMALFRLGPSGGLGGTNPFDDFEPRDPEVHLPPDNSRVHFVWVGALAPDENANPGENHPEVIHSIKIEHIVDVPADTFPLEEHGQPMQGKDPHPVQIARGDYIKRIEGTSERFVNKLTIIRANKSNPDQEREPKTFGKGSAKATDFKYEAPTGFEIVGFLGREGTLIDAIGVILRHLP